MTKILKPYTIIPQSLYVQRDADRQIKNIISDMGRPGYVLVSRQMGKTNLLLNAKRNLETPEDIFVYIDLSNPFESAKSCFENMIDTAIETNIVFEEVGNSIRERRLELKDTPPHKQHTNELRLLLKSIPGKLVIILDEIDALTKTDYSDQIFAQIRSIYFSRVNFKELEKLTYILSGVVEPNEIIKDPKISPFNIGQKIFLNDFNKSEFEQLVENSGLKLDEKLKDRIFYWTGGNPRMTWDVCSEIENTNITSDGLTTELVDEIVKQTYLTSFDKPPVDNIRELVAKDREIRNAVIEIDYNKGEEISDKTKSKLYLSGIINYDSHNIKIKNEIIKQSLNIEWIRSLEEEDKGLVRIAIEQFDKQLYDLSLNTFERFLASNDFDAENTYLCHYYMGYASYILKDFTKSIDYLDSAKFDIDEDEKWYYRVLNLKGLAFYNNGQIEDSLRCFQEIMESGRKDELYVRSLLNFTSIGLKSDKPNHMDSAIRIFEEIIDGTAIKEDKLKDGFIKELKATAHYNLGQIQTEKGLLKDAAKNFLRAAELGNDNIKPTIMLALIEITDSESEKLAFLEILVGLIEHGKIKPIEENPEKPIDFSFEDLKNISTHAFLYDDNLFNRIKPFMNLIGEDEIENHIYSLFLFAIGNKNWQVGKEILFKIYSLFNSVEYSFNDDIRFYTLKYLSYTSLVKEDYYIYIEYVNAFRNSTEQVDSIDLEVFAGLCYELYEDKKYAEALRYVDILENHKDLVPKDLIINFIVIYNLELNVYIALNDSKKAIQKAKQVIEIAQDEKIKQKSSSLLGDTGLEIIKQNAENVLKPRIRSQSPIKSQKTYGRNDRVKVRFKDGAIIETKFKKIQPALANGDCFILE